MAYSIHSIIREVWGNHKCAWNWIPLKSSASGGLISVWNEEVLVVEDVLQVQRVLVIKEWGGGGSVMALYGLLLMCVGLMLRRMRVFFWICFLILILFGWFLGLLVVISIWFHSHKKSGGTAFLAQ